MFGSPASFVRKAMLQLRRWSVRRGRSIGRPRHSGAENAKLRCCIATSAIAPISPPYHLPEDVLYILTLFVEGVSNAVRAHGGHISFLEQDSICALFGVDRRSDDAAQRAVQAAGAIAGVISDLNVRSGRQGDSRLQISIAIHAGPAAVGEIGSAETPIWLATGSAMDVANELRAAAARSGKAFAISEQVYQDAELVPPGEGKIMLQPAGSDQPAVAAYLLEDAPVPSPTWTVHGELGRSTVLKRLWAG